MLRIGVLLGAILVAAPAAIGSANVAIDDSLFAGETNVVPGTVPATQTCSATAPATTSCTSGTHLVLRPPATTPALGPIPSLGGISHGFAGVNLAGVTATLESRLDWSDPATGASGSRIFRCNVTSGVISCLGGSGTFPPVGASLVAHNCRSYDKGTLNPGGIGTWGCSITFTGVPDVA